MSLAHVSPLGALTCNRRASCQPSLRQWFNTPVYTTGALGRRWAAPKSSLTRFKAKAALVRGLGQGRQRLAQAAEATRVSAAQVPVDMTDQFINRSALTENFTVLPNALLNDDRVSGEGLALMVYLLSKPPSWQLSPTDIRKRFKWGRDKAYRVIADLIECGYIVKDAEREGGRFNVHVYFIYDTPQISPLPEKPDTEKPDPVNQDTIKNRETNHISIIERTKSNKADKWFDKFWL